MTFQNGLRNKTGFVLPTRNTPEHNYSKNFKIKSWQKIPDDGGKKAVVAELGDKSFTG